MQILPQNALLLMLWWLSLAMCRYIKTKKRSLNPIPKILFIRIWGSAVATGEKIMHETVPS